MSLYQLADLPVGPLVPAPTGEHRYPLGAHRQGHAHFWQRALSRRHLVRTATALAALGLAAGHHPPRSILAQASEGALPKPIPGGITPPFTGELLHHYLPGPGSEPSQITDFRGFVSVSHTQGEGTVTTGGGGGGLSTPTATGDRLLFDADMRFMQGLYIGEDGEEHSGTFAFIWLDLYVGSVDPEFKNQIHDFDPGFAPNGLFWTVPVPDEAVTVDLAAGAAEMHVRELDLLDYYSVPNALQEGVSEPASVGFDVYWHSPTATEQVSNAEQGFAATLLAVTSALEWSGQTADFAFVSDPAATSTSLFGRLGFEANGAFFPPMAGTPVAGTPPP